MIFKQQSNVTLLIDTVAIFENRLHSQGQENNSWKNVFSRI